MKTKNKKSDAPSKILLPMESIRNMYAAITDEDIVKVKKMSLERFMDQIAKKVGVYGDKEPTKAAALLDIEIFFGKTKETLEKIKQMKTQEADQKS
jgi:hypothetical protein